MITAPQLFAGILDPVGDEHCFYCGGICGQDNPVSKHVKDTFTNRDIVRRPAAQFICSGCVCTLNERADINLADEEIRKAQKTRLYSWIFSASGRIAYTQAEIEEIRGTGRVIGRTYDSYRVKACRHGIKRQRC